MTTLQEALKLDKDGIKSLKEEILEKAKIRSDLNAYIDLSDGGEGVPIAIKDNISVKGWELTACSNILKGYIAPYNATVIKKLSEAGLSAFGRTNMDEFAMGSTTESSCYGKTLNPHANDRTAGGSSGGSAAVVAAGLAVAALGSDTGGSIRQPASYCGVVGMKPTYGRVSRYGLGAYASSLDQIGTLTQNVTDAVILYNIISGYDAKDSTSATKDDKVELKEGRKLRIATLPKHIESASSEVKDAYAKAVDALRSAGHTIVEKELLDAKYDISAYYVTSSAEASANLARYDGIRYGKRAEAKDLHELYLKSRSEGMGDEVKRRIMLGNFVLSSGYYDAYYVKAQRVRNLIKARYDEIFSDADLILSPVSVGVAPKLGSSASPLEMYLGDMYTLGANLAGLPAISLPIANYDGLPLGLQLLAKAYDEQTLFEGALALEKEISYEKL